MIWVNTKGFRAKNPVSELRCAKMNFFRMGTFLGPKKAEKGRFFAVFGRYPYQYDIVDWKLWLFLVHCDPTDGLRARNHVSVVKGGISGFPKIPIFHFC
jgi:hypothetical protein